MNKEFKCQNLHLKFNEKNEKIIEVNFKVSDIKKSYESKLLILCKKHNINYDKYFKILENIINYYDKYNTYIKFKYNYNTKTNDITIIEKHISDEELWEKLMSGVSMNSLKNIFNEQYITLLVKTINQMLNIETPIIFDEIKELITNDLFIEKII